MTIQRYLQAHFCTALAAVIVAVAFLGVDQVQHLFEPPPLDLLRNSPKVLACFSAIVAMAGTYVVSLWWVVPPNPPVPPDSPRIEPGLRPRLRHWHATLSTWLGRTYGVIEDNMTRRQGWYALGLLVFGVLLIGVSIHAPTWPIIGTWSSRAAFCWLSVFWAVWLLVNPAPRQAGYIGRMLFRVLIAFTLFNLLGETLWTLAQRDVLSFRNYSLWAMLHVSFCVLMVGRITDHWTQQSLLPLRPFLCILLVIGAGVHPSAIVGVSVSWKEFDSSQDSDAATESAAAQWGQWQVDDEEDRWLQHLAERLEGLDPDQPAIVVAASGGGSRAALFTSLVYEQLRRWALVDQDGDPKTPPTLAVVEDAPRHMADQILLISSVSGGTLASSEYVSRTLADPAHGFPAIDKPRTCFEEEVRYRMREQIGAIVDWGEDVQIQAYGTDGPEAIRAAKAACIDPAPFWFHRSEYVDHVSVDFMAPLLRGALLPAQERGEAVQWFWRDYLTRSHAALRHTNLDAHRLPPKDRRRVPLLIANVTEVDRGSALLVGFPPLPPYFFSGKYARFHAFPCRALTNLDPEDREMTRVDFTEATRLSANFPWGFSSARLAPRANLPPVHLIDGGVFDNTGIATLRFVFERLHDWSEAARKAREQDLTPDPSYALAEQIMSKLRRRGLILLEIDSGAKQEPPGGVARALPGIFEPITALTNVTYTHADRVAQEHLRRLKKIFDGPSIDTTLERLRRMAGDEPLRSLRYEFDYQLEDGNITMFHSLRITCNHEQNIMTSWALSPTDKAKVFVQFLIESDRTGEYLAQLMDVQSRTSILLDQLEKLPVAPPTTLAENEWTALDYVEVYEDLLRFNRETEFELRKSDILQERTFAGMRSGQKGENLLESATPRAPIEASGASTPAADNVAMAAPTPENSPPNLEATAGGNRGDNRATPQPAVPVEAAAVVDPPELPVWKKFQSSPSARLRGKLQPRK